MAAKIYVTEDRRLDPWRTLGRRLLSFSSLRRQLPRRTLLTQPDDVFLVSYPRSGNTWLRVMLGYWASQKPIEDPITLQKVTPDLHHRYFPARPVAGLRGHFIKSHFAYQASYPKVIYIVRDPHDVLASYHRYASRWLDFEGDLPRFVDECLAGRIWPCSWQEHVDSWLRNRRGDKAPLLLKYEELSAEPVKSLETILTYLKIPYQREEVERAVAWATPERVASCSLFRYQLSEAKRQGFVTHAKPQGWEETRSGEVRRLIQERLKTQLQAYGYEANT